MEFEHSHVHSHEHEGEGADIINIARSLGEALKESKEYRSFCEKRDKMRKNEYLKAMLDDFKVQKSIYEIEKEKDDADEMLLDELSARLELMYAEISDNADFAAYSKAEEDLNVLMTAVNMTISSYIGAEEYVSSGEDGDMSCTHNCNTCPGCH